MIETTSVTRHEHRFKPSWINHFQDRVEQLSLRPSIVYAMLGVLLVLVQLLFFWMAGGEQDAQLLPVLVFNGLFAAFLLALIHRLDNQARTSLNTMEPALDMTGSERDEVHYALVRMPARAAQAAGLAMALVAVLMEQWWIAPVRYAALDQRPLFAVVFHVVDKGSAFLFGVFIYHTVRQLRLVSAVNANHIRINLYHQGPLQAFSRLTATTAVGLVVGVYGWILINPELLSDPMIFAFVGLITILAIVVFVLPLLGVHRRMESEKERLLRSLDLDFEAVFSQFNQAFRDDDYPVIERLNGTIASLDIQRNRIVAIPTWPWKPETAQFTLTAITLPLVLAILQLLAERALGW